MLGSIPIAFLAGVVSVATPCVLPLVPGYLSAVSAVEPAELAERRASRRIARSSLPFFAGFTLVFVALGMAAAGLADVLGERSQLRIAGFVLVVFGLAFVGLLPLPQRLVAPGLVARARSRGSGALLGAAFAVCAAPCIGPVLAGILVLAGDAGSLLRASLLLAVYSTGIAVAFLLAGIGFARALGAFRWLRDHYAAVQAASGAVLVAFGLLLFFDRDWWLRVLLNRTLETVGL
jgi:cytochrome c-type biogenesis protein